MKYLSIILLLLLFLNVFGRSSERSPHYAENIYKKLSDESLAQITNNLNSISKNESRLYLTLENLINLAENDIITPDQSRLIWEFLINSADKQVINPETNKHSDISINNKQYDLKNLSYSSLSVVGIMVYEAKSKLNFNQIMMLTILGIFAFGFIIFLLSVYLYRLERYGVMISFLCIITYNLLSFARNIQFQINCNIMPGILVNISFCLVNVIIHISLIKTNYQKKFNKIKEIFQYETNFSGKLLQALFSLSFFYATLFFFKSPLSQIPFYFSCYYLIYLLSKRFEMKMNKIFFPSWIFFFSCFSLLKIIYFYGFSRKNLILVDFEHFFKIFFVHRNVIDYENNPDFQYFGYIFSCLILTCLFPLFLHFQQKNLHNSYKTKEFSFYHLYKSIKSEMNKDNIILDSSVIYHHIYAFLMIALIYIGLKIKMSFLVIVCSFTFQNYLSFIIKDGNLFWRILFYLGSLYVSNAIFLIGKTEDKFALNLLSDFKDGYLIYYISLFSKAILIYYSIDASTSLYVVKEEVNNSSEENGDESEQDEEENNSDEIEIFSKALSSLFKFLLNYFFVVHLIVLAEEETSYLISLLFLIFALVSFSKLLIYHSLTKDEANRTLISFCVYLGGLRLAFLPGKMNSPLYLGCLLSNLSVFASYISFKNLLFMILSFFMLFGLFVQSLIMDTSFGMFLALINFSLLFSFLASKNASTIIYNFLILTGLLLSVFIFSGFSMNFYFKIFQYLIEKLVPNTAIAYLKNLKEIGELAEQAFAKQLLRVYEDFFFKNE